MFDEMVREWMERLLEKHGIYNEDHLTKEQILEEIKEEKCAIENERIWNLEDNIEIHEKYLVYLKGLLEDME